MERWTDPGLRANLFHEVGGFSSSRISLFHESLSLRNGFATR